MGLRPRVRGKSGSRLVCSVCAVCTVENSRDFFGLIKVSVRVRIVIRFRVRVRVRVRARVRVRVKIQGKVSNPESSSSLS